MLLEEIINFLEKNISPKCYMSRKKIYGLHYGNSKNIKNIRRVMFTVDLTIEAIYYALKNKFNLIISYYGLIKDQTYNFNSLLIKKLSLLTKFPILIFVLNWPFIAAEGGVCDTIVDLLYLDITKTFNSSNNRMDSIPIGRICTPRVYERKNNALKLVDLVKRVKSNLNMKKVSFVGNPGDIVKKVCIIALNSIQHDFLEKALEEGCSCLICEKITHENAIDAQEMGLALVEISHYNSRIITMRNVCNLLSLEFPFDEFDLFEQKDPIDVFI